MWMSGSGRLGEENDIAAWTPAKGNQQEGPVVEATSRQLAIGEEPKYCHQAAVQSDPIWRFEPGFLVRDTRQLSQTFSQPFEKPWPAKQDLRELVYRASDQFLYASTVLRFVELDMENPPFEDSQVYGHFFDYGWSLGRLQAPRLIRSHAQNAWPCQYWVVDDLPPAHLPPRSTLPPSFTAVNGFW